MEGTEARVIIKHLDDDDEARVGKLLLGMGLELVTAHSSISRKDEKDGKAGEVRKDNKAGEADLIFVKDGTTVIVEVSTKENKRAQKIEKFFDVFGDKTNIKLLIDKQKKRFGTKLDAKRVIRIYFDLSRGYEEQGIGAIKDFLGGDNNIVFRNEIEEAEKCIKKSKKLAGEMFSAITNRYGTGPIVLAAG